MSTPSNSKESLYAKVLLWAHERGAQGFTWDELESELNLDGEQLKWVQHVLHFHAIDVEKWFDQIPVNKNWDPVADTKNTRFYVSPKGATIATNYIHLRELEKSSVWAQWTAITSIGIGAIVGIGQIIAAFV